jgi:ABC-2 type transport system ATP-binding protein
MPDSILTVRHLVKEFGSKPVVRAVDDVSFSLAAGEILGFLGPNGAGKTTTIRMLITTLAPTSGEIEYFGLRLAEKRSEILDQVAFASTYTNLPLYLTVEENLDVHGRLYGLSRYDRQQRMKRFLTFFGVDSLRRRRITQLSAGQRTRVMLAKAFLPYPRVALLDEPTASLDPDIAHEVRAFVDEQRKEHGVSILFTSHNMDEVAALCDRVIFLRQGKIVATDTPHSLAASVSHSRLELQVDNGLERTIAYLEGRGLSYQLAERYVKIMVPEAETARLVTDIAVSGVSFSRIVIEKPSLEDFFLQLAKNEVA